MKFRRQLTSILVILLFCAAGIASRSWPVPNSIPIVIAPHSPPVQEETSPSQVTPSPDEELAQTPASPSFPDETPELDLLPEETVEELPPEEASPEEIHPLPATLPILMYHHVVPDGTTCNDMTVTESKLASDLQWLNDHGYETILPRQLISGKPLPAKPILITFDDGYRSNYELAYPLFQKYNAKAVISIMVYMQDFSASTFLTWNMCREMISSGLVEIGSHTYLLHNLDERNGNFTPGGINGIQRKAGESDADFKLRVLDDLQLSYDLIEQQLGQNPIFFAYPFGVREKDAENFINALFPVTVVTQKGMADLSAGTQNLNRWTVSMRTNLSSILPS